MSEMSMQILKLSMQSKSLNLSMCILISDIAD